MKKKNSLFSKGIFKNSFFQFCILNKAESEPHQQIVIPLKKNPVSLLEELKDLNSPEHSKTNVHIQVLGRYTGT